VAYFGSTRIDRDFGLGAIGAGGEREDPPSERGQSLLPNPMCTLSASAGRWFCGNAAINSLGNSCNSSLWQSASGSTKAAPQLPSIQSLDEVRR
jgi:hypothetical protein